MITAAIVTRRLKEGKTYEDFRHAWFHTIGFGSLSRLVTAINAFDPREIIVMGFIEADLEHFPELLGIDVKERLNNPLDEVIEQTVGRKFGIVVSEDDFSAAGSIAYKPPSIKGKETNLQEFSNNLTAIAKMVSDASSRRDQAKRTK